MLQVDVFSYWVGRVSRNENQKKYAFDILSSYVLVDNDETDQCETDIRKVLRKSHKRVKNEEILTLVANNYIIHFGSKRIVNDAQLFIFIVTQNDCADDKDASNTIHIIAEDILATFEEKDLLAPIEKTTSVDVECKRLLSHIHHTLPSDLTPSQSNNISRLDWENSDTNQVELIQKEILNAKEQVEIAMEKTIDRGMRFDALDQQTQNLLSGADIFRKRSRAARFAYCRNHWKTTALIAIVIIIVLLVISLPIALTAQKR